MAELFPIRLGEQIACVERELNLRKRVYPRRVADRRMTQALADKEIATHGGGARHAAQSHRGIKKPAPPRRMRPAASYHRIEVRYRASPP